MFPPLLLALPALLPLPPLSQHPQAPLSLLVRPALLLLLHLLVPLLARLLLALLRPRPPRLTAVLWLLLHLSLPALSPWPPFFCKWNEGFLPEQPVVNQGSIVLQHGRLIKAGLFRFTRSL